MWMDDSEKICEWLEANFPQPSLLVPNTTEQSVGSKVFPSFVQLLKSRTLPTAEAAAANPDPEKESNLLAALDQVRLQLEASGGPFLCGKTFTNVDANLLPKIKHALVVLREICGWEIPSGKHCAMTVPLTETLRTADNPTAAAIATYMQAASARPSWTTTMYTDKIMVDGWAKHVDEWRAAAAAAAEAQ